MTTTELSKRLEQFANELHDAGENMKDPWLLFQVHRVSRDIQMMGLDLLANRRMHDKRARKAEDALAEDIGLSAPPTKGATG